MRGGVRKLHRGEGSRGKQHKSKFYHGDLGPRKVLSLAINGYALGRIVAALKRQFAFISQDVRANSPSFMAYSGGA
jgi:hypothetical protein